MIYGVIILNQSINTMQNYLNRRNFRGQKFSRINFAIERSKNSEFRGINFCVLRRCGQFCGTNFRVWSRFGKFRGINFAFKYVDTGQSYFFLFFISRHILFITFIIQKHIERIANFDARIFHFPLIIRRIFLFSF